MQTAWNNTIEEANALETTGQVDEAQRIRSHLYTSVVLSAVGVTAVAKGVGKFTKDAIQKNVDDAIGSLGKGNVPEGLKSQTVVSPELEEKILYGQRATNSQGNATNRLTGAHSGNINNDNPSFAVETVSV